MALLDDIQRQDTGEGSYVVVPLPCENQSSFCRCAHASRPSRDKDIPISGWPCQGTRGSIGSQPQPDRRRSVGRGAVSGRMIENTGAGDWNRTNDLRFTKPLLYQLSYAGAGEREKTRWEPNDRMIASRLRRVNRRLSDRYFRCESGMAADFDAVEGGTHIGCCAS